MSKKPAPATSDEKPNLPPGPFESPLSEDAVKTLANLLFFRTPGLLGSISASDAAKVFGFWVWLMARERERTREKVRMDDAEIGGYEYIPTESPRDIRGVLSASDIVYDLLLSKEMQLAFELLLALVPTVQHMGQDGYPFDPLVRNSLREKIQAVSLRWYFRAKMNRDDNPNKAAKMREIWPSLRTWANTLPAREREVWLLKSQEGAKNSIANILIQGRRISYSWQYYLSKLGYRIENYAPTMELELPIYEPFSVQPSYKPPVVTPVLAPVSGFGLRL